MVGHWAVDKRTLS